MRYGYCIFCDDIRTEVGEKLSFMGTYNGVMFVPRFPVSLAKFCAHVTLVTPADRPYSSIVLKCYAPGEKRPLIEEQLATPERNEQDEILSDAQQANGSPISIVVAASLVFSPLNLKEAGLINVRAAMDDEPGETNIASLRVVERQERP